MECGYPKWSLNKVKQQMSNKQVKQKTIRKEPETPSKGMVVLPYVEGVSEQAQRIFKKVWHLHRHETYQHTQNPPGTSQRQKGHNPN